MVNGSGSKTRGNIPEVSGIPVASNLNLDWKVVARKRKSDQNPLKMASVTR